MRIVYDRETDTMMISLREQPIKESDEVRPGVIADFGYDGDVVRSRSSTPPRTCRTRSR